MLLRKPETQLTPTRQPDDSFPWNRSVGRSVITICLISLAIWLGSLEVIRAQQPGDEAHGHYFLVLDHSGSMNRTIKRGQHAGRTRWSLMAERAADFPSRLPVNSDLWWIIFRSQDSPTPIWRRGEKDRQKIWADLDGRILRGDEDRREAADFFHSYQKPDDGNNTALYDATGEALDRAQRVLASNPLAYVTVLIYTDGVDEGKVQGTPGSKKTSAEINAQQVDLKKRYTNFNVVNIYSPGDETIRDAHVVRLKQNRFVKPNLVAQPEATLDTGFEVHDTAKMQLSGMDLRFKVLQSGNAPAPIEVLGTYKLADGGLALKVVKARGVDIRPDQDVEATIQVIYPTIPDTLIVPEGGDRIVVKFQKASKPEISDLRPASGQEFPVGREVVFSLSTLSGTQTVWDFGDGEDGVGTVAKHRFTSPGKRTVKVIVTDPQTSQKAEASIDLSIIELGLNLDPMPTGVLPEKEVTLSASATGAYRRFEWSVNGQTYEGQPRKDGKAGTALALSFSEPGKYEVKLTGFAEKTDVSSQPATLIVTEIPRFRLVKPSAGETLYFNTDTELIAQVEGMKTVEKVKFRILELDGTPLMTEREVNVEAQGNTRRASYRWHVPPGIKRNVRVEAELSATLAAEAGLKTAKAEAVAELALEAPKLEVIAVEGREPYLNRPANFRAEANMELKNYIWDFGDGTGSQPGSATLQHVFRKYGNFTVTCRATASDGTTVNALPVELNVPVRPVVAKALVSSGNKQLGAQADTVGLHSIVAFGDQSEGDVVSAQWFYDDKSLPIGQSTVVVMEGGLHRLKLVVVGTPEAGRGELSYPFSARNVVAFLYSLAGTSLVLGLLGWLGLGNSARRWSVSVEPILARDQGVSQQNPLKKIGRWNWFTKKWTVPIKLIDRHGGWNNTDTLMLKGSSSKGPSGQFLWRKPGAPRSHPQFENAPVGRPIFKAVLVRQSVGLEDVDLAVRTKSTKIDWPGMLWLAAFVFAIIGSGILIYTLHSRWM
jgi:hypothetical protein